MAAQHGKYDYAPYASYCSCPRPATCLHCGHHVAPNGMLQSDCLLAACMHQTEELPPPPPTPPHPPTTPPRSEHDNRRLLLHLGTLAASKAGLSSSRHACGFSSNAAVTRACMNNMSCSTAHPPHLGRAAGLGRCPSMLAIQMLQFEGPAPCRVHVVDRIPGRLHACRHARMRA